MDTRPLEEIGLTKGEIAVYLSLLEVGSSTVGPIIDKAKVSSSKIYDILERLIDKGLVSYVIKENRKYFKAANPRRILEYLKEKEQNIKYQEKNIEQILPSLLQKQKLIEKKQEINIYEGIKGVKTAHEKTLHELKKGEEFYFMGVSILSTEKFKGYWQEYHKRREKAGIATKVLFNRNVSRKELDNRNKFKFCKAKYMPFEFNTPSWIEVFKETTIIGVPSEQPIALEIKNKEVAESFKSYFEGLWSQEVTVLKGIEEIKKNFWRMLDELKEGDEYYVLGATWLGTTDKMPEFPIEFHTERQRRKIKVKFLFVSGAEKIIQKNKELFTLFGEVKFLPSSIYEGIQINIYNNKVAFNIWREKEPIVMIIEDQKVYKTFKTYFDNLWNQDTYVLKGIDAIQNLFEEILEAGHCDWIGARGYFIDKRPEYIDDWEKRAIKKGFTFRNIVDKEVKGHRITKFPFAKTKYTIPIEFSSLSAFWIYGEKVVISNWMEKEPFVLVINNKNFHNLYKQQFELLWNKNKF